MMKKYLWLIAWLTSCLAVFAQQPQPLANPLPAWAFGGFVRPEGVNPVITPNPATLFNCPMQGKPVAWEESDTFNPAAAVPEPSRVST